MEGAKNFYNRQYESWVPWMEDKYLAWFGQNKTSYVAKGTSTLLQLSITIDKAGDDPWLHLIVVHH